MPAQEVASAHEAVIVPVESGRETLRISGAADETSFAGIDCGLSAGRAGQGQSRGSANDRNAGR